MNLISVLKSSVLFEKFDDPEIRDLVDHAEIVEKPQGTAIFTQGDTGGDMYIIIDGQLKVTVSAKNGMEMTVATLDRGKPIGEIQFLTGGVRTANVYAMTDVTLLKLSNNAFGTVSLKNPLFEKKLSRIIRRRLRHIQLSKMLPGVFGPMSEEMLEYITSELEWISLARDQLLFGQCDVEDHFYILVSGRLIVISQNEKGEEKRVGEVRPGESVGEMAMISGQSRSASVYAVRDSILVKIEKSAFEKFIRKYPMISMHMMKIMVHRLQQPKTAGRSVKKGINIAIVPAGPDVPITEFCLRLEKALSKFGQVLHVSSNLLDRFWKIPGSRASIDDSVRIRLTAWLDDQEGKYNYVLYESDTGATDWTQMCFHQADQILIAGRAGANPEPGELESKLLSSDDKLTRPACSLILLHPNGDRLPTGTDEWLRKRRIDQHHHVRWDKSRDFDRIARFLTGCPVGLVLGGGGARGLAHLGIIRVLDEIGIPVDTICGTSIGSVMAGLYAIGLDHEKRMEIVRKCFVRVNPVGDYTFPAIAMTKSRIIDRMLQENFQDVKIEDLWINYFCVSSNLTTSELKIHNKGTLWKAARASISIPGILVPVPDGNHLLVDGGVINNLPADILRETTGGFIMMVNVSPEKDLILPEGFDEIPSAGKYIWNKIIPGKKKENLPNILDILMRTTMLASSNQMSRVKANVDHYFNPPISRFGMLDFEKLDEIYDAGYEYAKKEIEEWRLLSEEIWEYRLEACLLGNDS